jgi:hypothetical protein
MIHVSLPAYNTWTARESLLPLAGPLSPGYQRWLDAEGMCRSCVVPTAHAVFHTLPSLPRTRCPSAALPSRLVK